MPNESGRDTRLQDATRAGGSKATSPKATDPHLVREDEDEAVTHPLNPDPERRSTRIAQRDERPGS